MMYRSSGESNVRSRRNVMSNYPKSRKILLSQATGKKKLLVALPGAFVAFGFGAAGVFANLTRFVAIALCAYAIVGLIEVALGDSLVGACRRWDVLAGWKKFLISSAVIVGALAFFISLISVFAQWL